MGKVSDNVFPKVVVVEATTPASPSSGQHKVFFDSADGLLKSVNSAGTVTTYGTGLDAEAVRDTIAAALVAGTNVTITVDDPGNTITIASSGSGGGGGGTGFTRLRKSATQTISSGTWTAVTWDTEDYDTLAMHDNVTNNSRLTAPSAGVYAVNFSVQLGTASGDCYIQFAINGTRVPGRAYLPSAGGSRSYTLHRMLAVSSGDYIEAFIFASGGATLTTVADDANVLEAFKLGTT